LTFTARVVRKLRKGVRNQYYDYKIMQYWFLTPFPPPDPFSASFSALTPFPPKEGHNAVLGSEQACGSEGSDPHGHRSIAEEKRANRMQQGMERCPMTKLF